MGRIIKWLNGFFGFIEIMAFGLICFGITFTFLDLPGANESFLVGFTIFALVLILRAITPFPKKYSDDSAIMNETLSLITRRIFYFTQAIYVFAILFAINELSGTDEMIILTQLTLIPLIFLVGYLLLKNKERLKVFQGSLVRFVGIFILNSLIYLTFGL